MEKHDVFLFVDHLMIQRPNADLFLVINLIKEQYGYQEENCAKIAADWYFARERHIECLTACSCYCAIQEQSEQLFAMASVYYAQYIEQYKSDYQANCDSLRNYIWYDGGELPMYEMLPEVLIYQNESCMIYMERSTGNMRLIKRENDFYFDKKAIAFVAGIASLNSLEQVVSRVDYILVLWQKRAFFAYYDSVGDFCKMLQTGKIENILKNEFVVFLLGWEQAVTFLKGEQCHYLNVTWFGELVSQEQREQLQKDLREIQVARTVQSEQKYSEILTWYRSNAQRVKDHIKCGKPKILFVTCRFTTAVQYHSRDCMEMCRELGLEVRELKEKSDIHSLYSSAFTDAIYEFRPDIIFGIDHFRKKDFMPPEIVHICWVQDIMAHIVSKITPKTLGHNDYILSHLPNKNTLIEIGYNAKKILPMPVSANHTIYKPYLLDSGEMDKYNCDICLVANGSSYVAAMMATQKQLNVGDDHFVKYKKVFDDYYSLAYNGEVKSGAREYSYNYLQMKCAEYKIDISEKNLEHLTEVFYYWTRASIHRSVMVEWLLDAGFKNIKLYGADWGMTPRFKQYAMGTAENGERLAKIYKAAKIVLGTNPSTTGAARVYECYLSGGFYISNYIEPENDIVNIRDFFKENEEIPFFYNREDLCKKVQYYLDHDEERCRISESVREKMLQSYTCQASMKRMVSWIQKEVDDNE